MDQSEAELNTSPFRTQLGQCRRVSYCMPTRATLLVSDLHDTASPWIFAAVASIMSLTAVLLNTLVIIAVNLILFHAS